VSAGGIGRPQLMVISERSDPLLIPRFSRAGLHSHPVERGRNLLIAKSAGHLANDIQRFKHTIRIRCWHLTQFLERFWEQHQALDEVTIAGIDAAIARKGDRDGYARTSIQNYTNTLRAFFRYAEQRCWCRPGLAAAIMSPHLFADEGLPKGPAWSDVQQLLANTEGNQPKNIRDRAIIMLFAVYGMRVGEVRGLKLEDLDWEKELLYLTRPKPRRRQFTPFPIPSGKPSSVTCKRSGRASPAERSF
jgi:integrase/recombinase XerD